MSGQGAPAAPALGTRRASACSSVPFLWDGGMINLGLGMPVTEGSR